MAKPFDVSKFRKEITKSIEGLSIGFNDPTDWVSTGNYALNYLISGDFNSEPGFKIYVEVNRSLLRAQKFFTYIKDRRYTSERQSMLVTVLRDDFGFAYMNQYGRVETVRTRGCRACPRDPPSLPWDDLCEERQEEIAADSRQLS